MSYSAYPYGEEDYADSSGVPSTITPGFGRQVVLTPSDRRTGKWRPLGDMEGHDTGLTPRYDRKKQTTRAMLNQLGRIPEYKPPRRRPIRARALYRQLITR
jgi:hypothetical protein